MFKTIIKTFETFCNSHTQIGEFDWGIMESVSAEERDFTMVWLMPTGVIQSQSMATFRFDMYVFDLVKQDKSNLLDVMNNSYMIGKDILGEFYDNEATYGFNIDETNGEPFDHEFDDYCGGWIFSIEVEAENTLNTCNIPTEDNITPSVVSYDVSNVGLTQIMVNVSDMSSTVYDEILNYIESGAGTYTATITGSDNNDGNYFISGAGISGVEYTFRASYPLTSGGNLGQVVFTQTI